MIATSPGSFRPAGSLDASTALQPYRGPWSTRQAAHLLRRAGFGGFPAEVASFAALSLDATVARLIRFPGTTQLAQPPSFEDDRPAALRRQQRFPQMFGGLLGGAPSMAEAPAAGSAGRPPAPNAEAIKKFAKAHFGNAVALETWWLERMIATPAPLQEKLTLFWHGHFTSAYQGKGISASDMLRQNQLYRSFALGNVRKLTLSVSQDPAMLKYLDNRTSRKEHPNENYARELMELFTLGIGNYSEADIRESARAFTGWTLDRDDQFVFNRRFHDDGSKTFLGRTGNWTGSDIVDIIFQQPAAPRFFATKLLEFFVYSDPEPELVEALAATIKRNDFELAPVMSVLLRSNVFHSDRAYRALVKSPTEFVVGTYKLYGLTKVEPAVLAAMNRMGQRLFFPPNVKGWDGGEAWLNSGTMLTRENFSSAVCQNPAMMQTASWLTGGPLEPKTVAQRVAENILQSDVSPASRTKLEGYLTGADTSALAMLSGENFDERLRGAAYLAMAMPAYQLN